MTEAGEAGQVTSRYPPLQPIFSLDSATSTVAEEYRTNAELFLTLRPYVPRVRDLIDVLVLNAIKLDLHNLAVQPSDRYWFDDSEGDKRQRNRVIERVGLPFWTANYLNHFSHNQHFLYVATPKVGCTTIKHYLQQSELRGALNYSYYGEEHDALRSPLLQPVDCVDAFVRALDDDDWFKFTFVRNPFSRALSCYIDKILNSLPERDRLLPQLGIELRDEVPSYISFLKAVAEQPPEQRDYHWAEQCWITQPDSIRYDFIGRFEHFERDFDYVCSRIGYNETTAALAHSTNAAGRYSEFYGSEAIELVREIYRKDFERFGYDDRLN